MEKKIACPGYEISTNWYEGSDASKVLIVLPGYSASKERQKPHAQAMVEQTGTSALVVDFSGHGTSPFELRDTRPAQHLLELVCVFDWVAEHHPAAEISVSACSYGGFLSAQLTLYREFKNLILRAPAIYRPVTFYDLWAKRIDNTQQYDRAAREYRTNEALLAKHPILAGPRVFTGNVLVVAHERDAIVPVETTNAYARAFGAELFVAEGFAHVIDKDNQDSAQLHAYQKRIADWLLSH